MSHERREVTARTKVKAVNRGRDLLAYLTALFLSESGGVALSVAIGWSVYDASGSPLALGFVGVAQLVPMVLLTLPAGEACDRLSPRPVLVAGLATQGLCALAFLALTIQ